MKRKIALITGVTGQDGAYLSDFLLKKGYEVHGLKRRTSLFNTDRIDHLFQDPHTKNQNFFLHFSDMTDSLNLSRIIGEIKPDEIYNLAAMSHVHVSFELPEYVGNVDALGTLRILEAVRQCGLVSKTKIYQASTSELFGKAQEFPQNEKTPFYPRSPYGVSKLYAYWITKNYREAYGIFASNGILFNHESPIRGETFVTRKITRTLARIVHGIEKELYIGNLNAKRDWGHAKDYVEMMWLILQHKVADDWVIATGKSYSVREFIIKCCNNLGIEIEFKNSKEKEIGIVRSVSKNKLMVSKGDIIIKVDKRYYRPTEVDYLVGDSSKAKKELGWKPKYTIDQLIDEMIKSDLKLAEKEILLVQNGYFQSKKIDEY
ncbi:MAG: GDP-mannose 4,6-dehydratase [Chloroflexi bacterium]|jgi:GDPmannose 4,6-dehydratase|nr:GDP-mannose 4,6-dehydratase [Chloroflexota bacterium]